MGLGKGVVARLDKCMYGTRDAGAIWESVYCSALVKIGFTQGTASPCCFFHEEWGVAVVVHGDDFTALGTAPALDLYEAAMQSSFDVKLKGRLGHEAADLKEMRVLNRIVRIVETGLRYGPDPRHVELLARALSLEEAKPAPSP